jgi:hypothetical protein
MLSACYSTENCSSVRCASAANIVGGNNNVFGTIIVHLSTMIVFYYGTFLIIKILTVYNVFAYFSPHNIWLD